MAQVCGLALGINDTAETLSFQCRRACRPVLPLYWEKPQSPFPQLSNEDNRATPSTSSATQQGLVCRARLDLRLLTQGLAHVAITYAGHFPASQARPPSSQSALSSSEVASTRLGTPSTPLPAGHVRGTRRLQPGWNSPSPPRARDGFPFPEQPRIQASPWRPLYLRGTGSSSSSGSQSPRPRLKGGRRVKGQGKLRRALA